MIMSYLEFFTNSIENLKKENRYRNFVNISRLKGNFPFAINNENGRKITVWCSNDYLGMAQNQDAIEFSKKSLDEFGIGSGGTRNISGNSKLVVELEKELASLHNKEAALCFVSGFVANDATIQALAKIIPDLVIFSDQKNHASIISGIKNSRLTKHIFKHNDLDDLENLLKQYPISKPKLIIFESVYSMDGDFGKIKEIVELAKKYSALTFIDEVHGVGLYGKNGGGVAQELGLENEIDIIQGTLAKAYGCIGGYISGKKEIIDAIRLNANGFIFSTSLPPVICAAAITNITHLKTSEVERKIHQAQVQKLKSELEKAEIKIVENQSHIVSVIIGDAKKAEEISRRLLNEHDIYVQHINYPTVAKGDERLRITVTPLHSDEMIRNLVTILKTLL